MSEKTQLSENAFRRIISDDGISRCLMAQQLIEKDEIINRLEREKESLVMQLVAAKAKLQGENGTQNKVPIENKRCRDNH